MKKLKINKLKVLEILGRVPLFKTLSHFEREKIFDNGGSFEQKPCGQPFIIEGSHDPYFYIILAGKAMVKQSGYEVATLEAGHFIGEVCFFCHEARTATVVALTDVLVMKIDRQGFQGLPAAIRERVKDKVIAGLVARVQRQNRELIELQSVQLSDDYYG